MRVPTQKEGYVQRVLALIAICVTGLTACGSVARQSAHGGQADSGARVAPAPAAGSATGVSGAEHPNRSQFPPADGTTLQQLARLAEATTQLQAGTITFTTVDRRVAFAVTDSSGSFIYAPTALYIAHGPAAPASGPFLAPADPMTVARQFASNEDEGPEGLQAIYSAEVPFPGAGHYSVLALSRTSRGLTGATGRIFVARSSPIPDAGQRPPAIETDTPASVNGKTALLTTRVPPEDMHAVSFKRVLGKRPIALLFSTPQLCQSKVCGPVTDLAVEMQHEFRNRITFIHEEVYVDNQPDRGLRTQLKAFHLKTEPWLFAINRRGVIAARLEGAFGATALRHALDAALR